MSSKSVEKSTHVSRGEPALAPARKSHVTSITFSADVWPHVEREAARLERSYAWVINRICKEYFSRGTPSP